MDNGKAAYFISDLHLGASYIGDNREHEKKIVRFLRSIEHDCAELYLLGDVLDFWFEYKNVAPRGFLRFFGQLARMADSGVRIVWLTGNHDIWLFDYLRDEIGIEVVDGTLVKEILGRRFLLAHGDAVGDLKWSFRLIRSLFRNRIAQKLAAAIHPRWLVGFAHGWSSRSRKSGGYTLPEDVALNPYLSFAGEYNRLNPEAPADFFLFGHQHVLVEGEIAENSARVAIIGDWIRIFSYARFDGATFEISRFE